MPGLKEAQRRHAKYFAFVLQQADELYLKGGESSSLGLISFGEEWLNIQKGQSWAEAHEGDYDPGAAELCSQYADNGSYLLNLRQHPRERIHWLETALVAVRRLNKRNKEGQHLGNLGLAYIDLGEVHRAIECYEEVLTIAREVNDRKMEGNSLGNLGNVYNSLGKPVSAINYYEQALFIDREIEDRQGEATDLGNLGVAYKNQEEYNRAIELFEQALVIDREIKNRRGEEANLGNLGNTYLALGNVQEAIKLYELALIIAREIGHRKGEGNALWAMSLALDKIGYRNQAIVEAKIAFEIYVQIEDPTAERVANQLKVWQSEPSRTKI